MAPRDHHEGLDYLTVSYSELNRLSQCEEAWYQNYVEVRESVPSLPMKFGTVIHRLADDWWAGDINILGTAWSAAQEEEVELEHEGKYTYDNADWLFRRYVEVYTLYREHGWKRHPEFGGEHSLTVSVPEFDGDGGHEFQVRVTPDDVLLDPAGEVVLVERKTMGDWGRIALLPVTPQETLQVWAARYNGIPVDVVAFDAIKTYRWAPIKPTQAEVIEAAEKAMEAPDGSAIGGLPWEYAPWNEVGTPAKRKQAWARDRVARDPGHDGHPPEDSLQFVFVYRDQEQIDGAVDGWVIPLMKRRIDLYAGAPRIKNIGRDCVRCPYQDTCWESLAFPSDVLEGDIEVEEF